MTAHSTGPYSIAIHLPPEELAGNGSCHIDDEWTRQLTLGIMEEFEINVVGQLEIEVFTGIGGLMIFAALHPESRWKTLFFSFERLEEVLELSERLNLLPPPKSILTYIKGSYILSLSAPPEEIVRLDLLAGEFGHRLYHPTGFSRHLDEHGKRITGPAAVQDLFKVIGDV